MATFAATSADYSSSMMKIDRNVQNLTRYCEDQMEDLPRRCATRAALVGGAIEVTYNHWR